MQAQQVLILQYLHSKMNQCGPEWHTLHLHWMRLLSDFRILKRWRQRIGTAIEAKFDCGRYQW